MPTSSRSAADGGAPSILHLVKQVQYKAYLRLEMAFSPLDVTAVQFRILTTLSRLPKISSAELARIYDVKPQTMIKQIALLEAKGLIVRHVSDFHKRLLEVTLTPAGASAIQQLQKDSRRLEREILSPLTADEQATLRDHLQRLLNSLSADTRLGGAEDGEEFTEEYRRAGVQRR